MSSAAIMVLWLTQALRSGRFGLVDAGQVVQHEHHGVGGVLVGQAGDVEGGLGHGAMMPALG